MANTNEAVHTNVKFKDRLFRIIFGAEENKKHLISLYNALNETDYGEDEAVETHRRLLRGRMVSQPGQQRQE